MYSFALRMTYNLLKLGITELNVMQQDMLLAARKWDRVVLLSPTGSGKTLAYLLPVLEAMDEAKDCLQTLVLVPSRELAIQTANVARRLCPACRVMACYGGHAARARCPAWGWSRRWQCLRQDWCHRLCGA